MTPSPARQIPASSIGLNIRGNAAAIPHLWGFAALWIAFTSFGFVSVMSESTRGSEGPPTLPVYIVFALFFAAGLFMLSFAAYVTLLRVRFGRPALHLEILPCMPGGTVTGTIRTPRPLIYRDAIRLRLACIRGVVREASTWDNGCVQENHVLWEDRCTLDRFSPGAAVPEIPVSFTIPPDAMPSCNSQVGQQVLWRLEVRARTAGIPYAASFLVPVLASRPPLMHHLPEA